MFAAIDLFATKPDDVLVSMLPYEPFRVTILVLHFFQFKITIVDGVNQLLVCVILWPGDHSC